MKIISDVDGTLLDPTNLHTKIEQGMVAKLVHLGHHEEQARTAVSNIFFGGQILLDNVDYGVCENNQWFGPIEAMFGYDIYTELAEKHRQLIRVDPSAIRLVESYSVIAMSAGPTQSQTKRLEFAGLLQYMKASFFSDGQFKKDSAGVDQILCQIGPKEEIIVIGDMQSDIRFYESLQKKAQNTRFYLVHNPKFDEYEREIGGRKRARQIAQEKGFPVVRDISGLLANL